MSLNPVYLWNPQNFPDPQAMLPGGFDAAHRIVSEWADQPLPQGADTSAFDKLAGYIAEAARSGKASADFKAAYADIETQIAEQLKSRAVLELYEHYLELMPILTCRSESLGLVLYDANGYLLLPDGFDAAHRIVSKWADQPLPQGADTSAFDKLAEYIAEAARADETSAAFKGYL